MMVGMLRIAWRLATSGSASVSTLADHDGGGPSLRERFDLGRDDAARAAPRSPEVDDDRDGRVAHELVEVSGRENLDRVARWGKRALALTAVRVRIDARSGDPILGRARVADDDHG
jgi:hypothetical protein